MDTFIINYYIDALASYKTPSTKKAFLTRSKKEVSEFLEDLKVSVKGSGWLHGNRVNISHVIEQEQEIEYINKLYKQQ